ncbi:MAG: hypothetical protein WCA46_13170 [Actinocatenispora sp.]
MSAPHRPTNSYAARDELRGMLLVAAVAAVPDRTPVIVTDQGPHGAGVLCDGAATTLTSRIRVEIGESARLGPEARLAAVRRHLIGEGWSMVRSGSTDASADLVAVRHGYTMTVVKLANERRVILTGETPPLPV